MRRVGPAAILLAMLGGCGGGSGQDMASAPPGQAPMSVDFTTFTKAVVASRSDTSAPIPVTASEFVFPDDDNPAAFAAVLSGP